MQFSVRTRIAKTKNAVNRAIILFYSTPALSVLFFSIIEHSVLVALVFHHKYMLEKVKMERTLSAILSFFFVTERTQLNAAHA